MRKNHMWLLDNKIKQYLKHAEYLRRQLFRLGQQSQNGLPLALPKSRTEITYDNSVPHSRTQMWQPNYQLKKPIQNEPVTEESNLTCTIQIQQTDNLPPQICPQKNHANSSGKNGYPNSVDKLSSKNNEKNLQTKL